MPLKAVVASCGNSDSIITRLCRIASSEPGTESISTGQASTQAGAGGAGPDLVHVHLRHDRVVGAVRAHRAGLRASISSFEMSGVFGSNAASSSAFSDDRRALRVAEAQDVDAVAVQQVHLDVAHDLRRLERLARRVRRAGLVAAVALGAGEGVEQRLPRQLLHAVDAELLGLLEVDRGRQAVALLPEEVDVRRREDEVHVLRHRDVRGEAEEHEHVRPPGHAAQRARRRRPAGRRAAPATSELNGW